MRTLASALAAVAALSASAGAAETAAFLRIPVSARAAAMGEALVADAEATDALSVNPAGVAAKTGREAAFSHAELLESQKLEHLAYAQGLGEDAAAGLTLRRLSYGDLEGRDAVGARTGSFDAADLSVGGAYARRLAPGLLAGGAVHFVESKIADRSARSFSVDLGGRWTPKEDGPLSFGAAARNLGPGLKLGSETEPLPAILSAGAAWRPCPYAVVTGDLRHRAAGSATTAALGVEARPVKALAVRGGWSTVAMQGGEGRSGGVSGLTAGVGIAVGRVSVDYAFAPLGDGLDDAHRVALIARF